MIIYAICKFIAKIFKKNQDENAVNSLVPFVKFGIVNMYLYLKRGRDVLWERLCLRHIFHMVSLELY